MTRAVGAQAGNQTPEGYAPHTVASRPVAKSVAGALTPEQRAEIRACLIHHDANNALRFQAKAIKRYGAAAGVLCRELLFWEGKGHDPDGFIYLTKQEGEERMGLSAKSQDGARKRLEDAGVLQVERRPRRNADGRIVRPSPVLHYRLDLGVLFEQLTGETFDHWFKHADADARTRGLGDSSTPIGILEHADKGAPYTEGTSEGTSEVTSEAPLAEVAPASKEKRKSKYTKRGTRSKKTTQEPNKGDLDFLFVNRHEQAERISVADESATSPDKRHASSERDSVEKAAGEEDGSDARPDYEAPRTEEATTEEGDEPVFDHEAWKARVLGRPVAPPVAHHDLSSAERSEVAKLVYHSPVGGNPKTRPGRFALACARGEEVDGAAVTPLKVAEEVREAMEGRKPVEAYLSTVEGELEELRSALLKEVAV